MTVTKKKTRLPLSVSAFLLVFGLVVALNAINLTGRLLLTKATRKVAAKEGAVTLTVFGEALLLRREQILVAPSAGIWHPKVAVSERLPANTPIGEILTADLLEQAQLFLEKAKSEKTLWESQLAFQKKQVEQELSQVGDKITQLLAELKDDLARLETRRTGQLNSRLQQLLKQRSDLLAQKEQLANGEATGGAWRQIEAEARELMDQASVTVYTPLSGMFLDQLDGWEDVFDPLEYKAALADITPSGSVVTEAVEAGSYVVQGQILGKITQEEPTFIRVHLNEKLEAATLNDPVQVLFPEEQVEVKARVVAIHHHGNETIAILQLQNGPPALASVRETKVQLIKSRVQGALIPEKALIRQNSQVGVFCWQQSKWEFTPVEVKAVDQGEAIVSGIRPGDEISLGLGF